MEGTSASVVATSANGSYAAAGDRLGRLMLIDRNVGASTTQSVRSPINRLEFSGDESYLAAAESNGVVHVYRLPELVEVSRLEHTHPKEGSPIELRANVDLLRFSPDNHYLATTTFVDLRADVGYALHVWPLRTEDLVREACHRLTDLGVRGAGCAAGMQ